LGGLFLPEGAGSNSHGGASRQAVVHQNHCAPPHITGWTTVAIFAFLSLEFAFFFGGYGLDHVLRNLEGLHDALIQHTYAP
jgi:hypothetical protein